MHYVQPFVATRLNWLCYWFRDITISYYLVYTMQKRRSKYSSKYLLLFPAMWSILLCPVTNLLSIQTRSDQKALLLVKLINTLKVHFVVQKTSNICHKFTFCLTTFFWPKSKQDKAWNQEVKTYKNFKKNSKILNKFNFWYTYLETFLKFKAPFPPSNL